MNRGGHRYLSLLLAPLLLSGCLSNDFPTQSRPSCSWTTEPPSNAGAVCSNALQTLRTVLRAAITGDDATLVQLVPDPVIRDRIAAFGYSVRRKGNVSVHITPSFTLAGTPNGTLGAAFNIVGSTHHGDVKAPQTVYLARRNGRQVIVHDQPMQEW